MTEEYEDVDPDVVAREAYYVPEDFGFEEFKKCLRVAEKNDLGWEFLEFFLIAARRGRDFNEALSYATEEWDLG